jgi:very-short-patch-repair endonuclease
MAGESKREQRHRVPPTATARARAPRKEAPVPERLLWSRLRAGQLAGVRFRRQHPLGPYILDFYCASRNLAIELDGMSHDERVDYDARRTAYLESAGLHVVRFSDDEVLTDLDGVVQRIVYEVGLE